MRHAASGSDHSTHLCYPAAPTRIQSSTDPTWPAHRTPHAAAPSRRSARHSAAGARRRGCPDGVAQARRSRGRADTTASANRIRWTLLRPPRGDHLRQPLTSAAGTRCALPLRASRPLLWLISGRRRVQAAAAGTGCCGSVWDGGCGWNWG